MPTYLFATFVSFLVHAVLIVPFINLLYKKKVQRQNQITKDAFNQTTPIFDTYNQHKAGVPVGGGMLIITTTLLLYLFFFALLYINDQAILSLYPSVGTEIKIVVFTFLGFGLLGVYDDITKIFLFKKDNFFGLRLRHKLVLEVILAFIIAYWLYDGLSIDFINIPFFGQFSLGYWYIGFAAFVIIAFSNAVNITDGLDGLATGVLMIALTSFWMFAARTLDIPLSLFIGIWLGGLVAFLYFNIPPARIMLGDSGSLSFGAVFAVIGLMLGKAFSLPIIGGVFVLEIASSLLQLLSKRFRKRKVFAAAPLHLFLQYKGWEESKIVMRFWLLSIMCAVVGLMLAFLR